MSAGSNITLGELRPSQLLYTYGIGAVVDLPHISAMIMGLEDWNLDRCTTIAEERLLRDVRRFVGEQVQRLVAPPTQAITTGPWMSSEDIAIVGVPVAPFPRWMRCPACSTLAPLSSGLFQLKAPVGRPDLARDWLVRAVEQRNPQAAQIVMDPMLNPWRNTPEFRTAWDAVPHLTIGVPFPGGVAAAEAAIASLPEPASLSTALGALVAATWFRRRRA